MSVLVLKEGWDVRNVTTIVGLRAYVSQAKILPEQTLGRGLRRMYFGTDAQETVSVMGTPAFMDFVESIQSEGVVFEHVPMGGGARRDESLVVEVAAAEGGKDIDALDIEIPRLSRRYSREYKELEQLDPATLEPGRLPVKPFTPEETREIVFKTMLDGDIHHTIRLDGAGPVDFRSVIGFFARQMLNDLRLVGGYDMLYGKVKTYVRESLFAGPPVDLEDAVILRNLSEPEVGKVLHDTFIRAINGLTVRESGSARVEDTIRLRDTRPFRTDPRTYYVPTKSLFTKIVGEPHAGGLELRFARFLDDAPDVVAFAKNYLAVGFRLDYVRPDSDLSNYTPDFLVRTSDGTCWVVETKGRAELDLPAKMKRLAQWCDDATKASAADGGPAWRFVYVDEAAFAQAPPATFAGLAAAFLEYQ